MKKSGRLKSNVGRSIGFKSVTFNVQKTLNDSHSVIIQLNSQSYFPGDTVNGYVYLNFSENLPSDSIDLIIAGYEETNFTLKVQPDIKEQEGVFKHFAKKVYLLKGEKEYIPAGEYVFPFQFVLPNDLPASLAYQDNYCTANVKYEVSLSMISKNKEVMEDLLTKKMIYVYEKKKIKDFANLNKLEKHAETLNDSKVAISSKERLLDDYYKTFNEEIEDSGSKTEYYEFPIVFKSFCCFAEKSLLLSFTVQKPKILIGEPFLIINKIHGFISLDFIHYGLYRETKCESSSNNKFYCNKTLIEEVEVSQFPNNRDMSIKVNFHFKGNLELKVSRMPSCHGHIINCCYYVLATVKINGICGQTEKFKIPLHVCGEVTPINPRTASLEVENVNFDEDFKSMSHPLQIIVLK